MTNLLYLSLIDCNDSKSGITKKILGQVKAFVQHGLNVFVTSIDKKSNKISLLNNNKSIFEINCSLVKNFTASILPFFYYIPILIRMNNIKYLYIRHNKYLPLLIIYIRLLFKNIILIYEFPTYPDIKEVKSSKRLLTYLLDRFLISKSIDRIATYSLHHKILGIPTININNGYNNFDYYVIPKPHKKITFTIVAFLCFWHGVDRFLYSLKKYRQNDVIFNIVGEGPELNNIKKIVESDSYLKSIVKIFGLKTGDDLREIYNNTNIAIASLACHRKSLYLTSELKIREYLSVGLPIVYSTKDSCLPSDTPFAYRIPSDETLININSIINWYKLLNYTPQQINEYARKNLSWFKQIQPIVNYIISKDKNDY